MPFRAETKIEVKAELKITGPELQDAVSLSILRFSQPGTKIIPPPIPSVPPKTPVKNPNNRSLFKTSFVVDC